MPISEVWLGDCMEYLKETPDKWFDLAIVDPEYGIDVNMNLGVRKNERKKHQQKGWDKKPPTPEYFKELFRVSKNQIIWGGNCFTLPISYGWIYWDKQISGDVEFSAGELAWTSFNQSLKCFSYRIQNAYEKRIPPTQKPTALYHWLLTNYAKPGDKILDTHLGSQSSRIAAYKLNFDFWGSELDPEYFQQGCERFEKAIAEPLFDQPKSVQTKLL